MKKKILLLFVSIFLIFSCSKHETKKPQLLIYCGVTMVKPMREISNIFEKKENCIIQISHGATGDLYKSIISSKVGDLFLPASHKFVDKKNVDNLFSSEALYSYNEPALFVKKGNPKGITNDVMNLANDKLKVIIGNPESCSIGMVTKRVLEEKGIYEKVFSSCLKIASDSRDINLIMKSHDVDLAINWMVTSGFKENKDRYDMLEIPNSKKHRELLSIFLIKYSKHKELSKMIMDYVVSEEGKAIFSKHGFETEFE